MSLRESLIHKRVSSKKKEQLSLFILEHLILLSTYIWFYSWGLTFFGILTLNIL